MHIDNVIFLILSKNAYTKFSAGPKGMIQLRLKAHEKFANRKCLLAAPLPGGGYFICLWLPAHP